MGIQQEQLAAGANNKRREHDEDHQQGAGADDHRQARRRRQTTVLLMEYTAEDAARFDEEMARIDKLFDDSGAAFDPATAREPVASFPPPWLPVPEPEEEEVLVGEGGRRRVSKASIRTIRSFARRSGYRPFPERFLSNPRLFTRAAADEVRVRSRIMSKLYAESQAHAREILHHYDAKGYLEYDADGYIDLSTCTPGPGH